MAKGQWSVRQVYVYQAGDEPFDIDTGMQPVMLVTLFSVLQRSTRQTIFLSACHAGSSARTSIKKS